jgi:hypothetical protein
MEHAGEREVADGRAMTATEKLARVAKLCEELQGEEMHEIIEGRIEGLAKELKVNLFQCALLYWALKGKGEWFSMFGSDVKIRFKAR